MDREDARAILSAQLDALEYLGYEKLSEMIAQVENREVTSASGVTYQIELQVFWDSQPGGTIRILGSIDDGGWRAFLPLSDDRLVAAPRGR